MLARPLLLALLCLGACVKAQVQVPKEAPAATEPATAPRLVVQVTVDQLRTDLLSRYAARFTAGGLRRFLDEGVRYDAARYAHAITETAVGHATLFTGALPSEHGIVGNEWYDGTRVRTSVEDPEYTWVGAPTPEHAGTAPTALRTTTWGDELVLASSGEALVFSVSLKDRSAILPGGHAGKAFWYDERSGDFVTSTYYYAALPPWVEAFRARRPQDAYPATWALSAPPEDYVHASEASAFPRPLGAPGSEAFYRALKHTPFGDELTLDFVQALLEAEPLGRDDVPDLLAISFSATDAIGHTFGPDSLEAEDNLLRLDRVFARLFELLLAHVDARALVVILSADHGACSAPEVLRARGLPGGRHPSGADLVEALNQALARRFGEDSAFVTRFVNPTFWLDEAKITARNLRVEDVENAVAEALLAREGFARAVTRSALLRGELPDDPLTALVRASFDRERTGHVYAVPESGWLLANDATRLTSMHGTPHAYDRAVPIAFWGAGLPARRVVRAVDPRAIAPTLAVWLGLPPPSGSSGEVLRELFENAP